MTMLIFILGLLISPPADGTPLRPDNSVRGIPLADSIQYHDGHDFTVVGRYHDEKSYARFPVRYKNTLREKVWSLGQSSAGISIRFRTNASSITARWTVLNNAHLPHMPDTGVKGVDLYVYEEDGWEYVKTGFPREKTNEYQLVSQGDGAAREYLLYLPLYDGVESLEIGVNREASISKPQEMHLLDRKPIVYYGTSITQGGCASRPGLAFTNILSRKLDRPIVNLGFSGNGTMETSVGQAMCEADAALYVVDCNPNTSVDLIHDRAVTLVRMLKKERPDVPVLLVEGFLYDSDHFSPESNQTVAKKNRELRRAFETLQESGIDGLRYQKADGFIGKDHEGTVDGVHPNDLGMMRIANSLLPVIKKLL